MTICVNHVVCDIIFVYLIQNCNMCRNFLTFTFFFNKLQSVEQKKIITQNYRSRFSKSAIQFFCLYFWTNVRPRICQFMPQQNATPKVFVFPTPNTYKTILQQTHYQIKIHVVLLYPQSFFNNDAGNVNIASFFFRNRQAKKFHHMPHDFYNYM